MHYKDGTEPRLGDIVKGTGYNARGSDGVLEQIVGTVIHLTPGSEACNIQVLHNVRPANDSELEYLKDGGQFSLAFLVFGRLLVGSIEYGQSSHFEKIG